MTRRLTMTMVSVVAGALLVVTAGTFFVGRMQVRDRARRELGGQAERLARRMETVQRVGLAAVQVALRLEDGDVVCLGPTCGPRTTDVPAGLTRRDLDPERLRAGQVVTGSRGDLVFAAAPADRGDNLTAVVLTRRVGASPGVTGPWFFVLVALTLVGASAVAADLGRRLVRPLREAQAATGRIASGDLATRVREDPADGEELAALGRSINAMAEALDRSRGMERQFLLSVSHELRTPLTSIRGFAEALSEGKHPDPTHAAGIIGAEARRLERLVGDLLELAKLDARRFSLDVRAVDVAEVVTDTAEGFRPAAEAAGVMLSVVGDEQARTAAADPDRLAQIVANLIENALKFASGSIAVGSGQQGDTVTLWVEDDGPGVPPEELPHVFEPFWRSTRFPARQAGTGLGLAIVAELVAAMGGSATAEPLAEGGTRVVVNLRPWRTA